MKRILFILTLWLAATVNTLGAGALQGKTILFVYGGWEGHDPVGCKDLFVPWLQKEGAEVILSDSLSVYNNKDIMGQVDLIIQTWTMGTLQASEENALLEAVSRGVGLAGWHGGLGDSFRNSTGYQFMVGGQFVAHPGGSIHYDVEVKDKKSPLMKGIRRFHVQSELYYMHVDPCIHVLATTRMSGEHAPWLEGVEMPVVWTKMYGQGRVFYSSIGHVAADFQIPQEFAIMKRGICWAVK